MPTQTVTLRIGSKLERYLQSALNRSTSDPEHDHDGVIDRFSARFGGGWEADIKACNGDSPYVDPVLFFNGNEVQVLDVRENLCGTYEFYPSPGKKFVVKIWREKGRKNSR